MPWDEGDVNDFTLRAATNQPAPAPEPFTLGWPFQSGSDANKAKDQATYTHGRTSFKDLPKRKIKFNPPLHKTMRPKGGSSTLYAPRYGAGDKDQVWENPDKRTKGEWRLGHIVGGDEVLKAYKDDPELKYRYGFRFLYNPTSITMNASINKSLSPDALTSGSGSMLISASGLGTVSLELLLNRIPEVNAPDPDRDADLTDQEYDLRNKGTMVDLDYLFRVANGTWDIVQGFGAPAVEASAPTDGGEGGKKKRAKKPPKIRDAKQAEYVAETGDIGIVIPTPAWLTLGPGLRYYGWMQSVNFKHTMFSEDMVPMLTRVTIVFQRILKGTKPQFEELRKAASQAAVISGDVFEPPVDTETKDPGGGTGEGQYPPWKKWESDYFAQDLPGPKEGYNNVIAAARAIHSEFPEIKTVGGWRPSDPYPDHPSGLALDIMIPGGCVSSGPGRKLGDRIAEFFQENKNVYAVKYMIWQQRYWSTEENPPAWQDMNSRGDCTADHRDHVHLALYAYPNDQDWNGPPDWKIKKGSYWERSGVTAGGWQLPAKDFFNAGYDFGASRDYGHHSGEDYPLSEGTNLYAMTDCVVAYIDDSIGRITMRTTVPGGKFNFCYLHTKNRKVKVGDHLSAGDHVAQVSGTGGYSPHLHLDFWWGTDNTPYNADKENPNTVIRSLFGPTRGDDYPSQTNPSTPNYDRDRLQHLRQKLGKA